MKPTRSQLYFLAGIFLWLGVLQIVMLGYLAFSSSVACNSLGAWPLPDLPFLGNGFITFIFTLGLGIAGWQMIKPESDQRVFTGFTIGAWALIVGSGLSHTLERLASGCVLDYWYFHLGKVGFYFNLGDAALTGAVVFLILTSLFAKRIIK